MRSESCRKALALVLVLASIPAVSAQCEPYSVPAEERCDLVQTGRTCVSRSLVPYLELYFCHASDNNLEWLVVVGMVLLLCVVGRWMLVVVEEYLAPSVIALADRYKLSPNAAGVLFVGLAVGAPIHLPSLDVMRGSTEVSLLVLVSGAALVMTLLLGLSLWSSGPSKVSWSMARDVLFLLTGTGTLLYILLDGRVSFEQSVGLMGLYGGYLVTVVVWHCVERRRASGAAVALATETHSSNNAGYGTVQGEELVNPASESTSAVHEEEVSQETRSGAANVVHWLAHAPLRLTVPLVHRWSCWLNIFHLVATPILSCWAYGLLDHDHAVASFAPFFLIGWLLALMLFMSAVTGDKSSPQWRGVFAIVGYLGSVAWFLLMAWEVGGALSALGVVMSASEEVVALTFMPVGHLVGAAMVVVVLARRSSPDMAVAACFGASVFNMSFSVGFGTWFGTKRISPLPMRAVSDAAVASAAFVLAAVACHVVAVLWCGGRFEKRYGMGMTGLYLCFLVAGIVVVAL